MPSANRIDVHQHIIRHFYRYAVYAAGHGPAVGRYPDWSPAAALEVMDARALARQCNDYAATLIAEWPKRFGAFTLVPVVDVDDALAEIEYGFDTLHFQGVCLLASYGEKYLGDPTFDPILELLNERDAVVFIHPTLHPSSRGLQLPWPAFMMEYPFDTTRAAVNLLFSGRLERFPRIKFILAHAGGTLPYLAWRISVSPMIDPRMPQPSRDDVFAGLRKFYYDNALSCSPTTMGVLKTIAAPDRILFGSD